MGLSRNVSEIDGNFSRNLTFSPPPVFYGNLRPRWWGSLRNWVAAQGVSKLEWWGKVNKFYDRFVRLDTIPAFDRRTDRHVAVAKTALCYASRGKDQRRYTTNLPNIVTDNSVVITLSAITILRYHLVAFFITLLHCALSLAAQCIVIGPVCGRVWNGRAGGRCLLPR